MSCSVRTHLFRAMEVPESQDIKDALPVEMLPLRATSRLWKQAAPHRMTIQTSCASLDIKAADSGANTPGTDCLSPISRSNSILSVQSYSSLSSDGSVDEEIDQEDEQDNELDNEQFSLGLVFADADHEYDSDEDEDAHQYVQHSVLQKFRSVLVDGPGLRVTKFHRSGGSHKRVLCYEERNRCLVWNSSKVMSSGSARIHIRDIDSVSRINNVVTIGLYKRRSVGFAPRRAKDAAVLHGALLELVKSNGCLNQ